MKNLGVVACLALVALSSTARAQAHKVASVAVALDRRLESDAVAATLVLQRLVQNDARFESIDLGQKAQGDARAQRAAQADKASALVAEALNALDEMKEQVVLAKTSEALDLYEKADLSVAFPGLLDAMAARAFAYHSLKKKSEAKADLARIFALKADYKLDPRRVTPDLSALADDARAKRGAGPRVALEVRSLPVPAALFIDGVYKGVTPLEVQGLAPGHHYVTLSAPGYDLAQSSQAAGLGAPVELTLVTAPGEKGLLEILRAIQTSSPPGAGGSAAALAKWAGADQVLIAGLQKTAAGTSAVVSRFWADGKLLVTVEKDLPRPEAIEDLAREVLAKEAGSGSGAVPPPPPPISTEPVGQARQEAGLGTGRTWGIVTGAVAVAALGGGIGLGLAASSKAKDARNTPLMDKPTYDSTASTAKHLAIGADVLYGVAAVGAGIATWLIVTGGPKASSSDAPAADKPKQKDKGEDLGFFLGPVQGGAVFSMSGSF